MKSLQRKSGARWSKIMAALIFLFFFLTQGCVQVGNVAATNNGNLNTGGTGATLVQDAEPNDTIATALPVTLGTDALGTISTATDTDYYSVTTTANSIYSATITPPAGSSFYIQVYDSAGNVVAGGINSTTVTWNAYQGGSYYIQVFSSGSYDATASYTLNAFNVTIPTGIVADPVFSPAAGTYYTTQDVAISTVTAGSTIHYTLDGTNPNCFSAQIYSTALAISATTTIKAIGCQNGYTTSAIISSAYTMGQTVAALTVDIAAGTYMTPQNIGLTTATTGASIYYTIDGSTPVCGTSNLYTAAGINVASSMTIKAIGCLTAWADSAVLILTYTINGTVAVPVASPAAGTFNTSQFITISTATSGANIFYTTDGVTIPTCTGIGLVYGGSISISQNTTVKAVACKAGWADSVIAIVIYNFQPDAPTMTVAAGTYTTSQNISLNFTTVGSILRYTTDGSQPTCVTGVQYYGAPVNVTLNTTMTIKAVACVTGWSDSAVASATYIVTGTVHWPTFSPVSGLYYSDQNVTMSSATSGSTICYTTDGVTNPSCDNAGNCQVGTTYNTSVPVTLGANQIVTTTLKAIACKTGYVSSNVNTGSYTIQSPQSTISDILSFSINHATGTSTGLIDYNNGTVDVIVPFGTNVTNLVANFTLSTGATAMIFGISQTSGLTTNDFSVPVFYDIYSADGLTMSSYMVSVFFTPDPSLKDFLNFSYNQVNVGIIDTLNKSIDLLVPFGTNIASMVVEFTLSQGASASISVTPQISGITVNDFSQPLIYTVMAMDGTTINYTIRVTINQSAKDVLTFSLPGISVFGSIDTIMLQINLIAPVGANLTGLAADFTLSPGATASVAGFVQQSGITLNDFSLPVNYVITAPDGSTAIYAVSINFEVPLPGQIWTTVQTAVTAGAPLTGIAWSGTYFIVIDANGNIYNSTDSNIWNNVYTSQPLTGIACNAVNMCISVGLTEIVNISYDGGASWSFVSTLTSSAISNARAVAWSGNEWVVVGDNGNSWHSTDGLSWVYGSQVTLSNLNALACAAGNCGTVGNSGVLLGSLNNGVLWLQLASPTVNSLYTAVIRPSPALSFSAGDFGTILSSSNGFTWTMVTTGSYPTLRGSIWTGSLFILTGDSGTIITSSNDTSWIPRDSGITDSITGVAWSPTLQKAVAVGNAGSIIVSQ